MRLGLDMVEERLQAVEIRGGERAAIGLRGERANDRGRAPGFIGVLIDQVGGRDVFDST